jgi:hypothetical protein
MNQKRIDTVEGAAIREVETRLGTRANGPIEFFLSGFEELVGVQENFQTTNRRSL